MATVIRNTDPTLPLVRDLYNSLKSQVGSRSFLFEKAAADAAASTATAETVVFVAGGPLTLTNLGVVPSAALTADAANNATITITRRNADGTGNVTVATLVTDVAGGSWTAFVRKNFGTMANTTMTAGQMLTLTIAKGGTGVVVPSFQLDDTGAHLDRAEYALTAANSSSLATALLLVNQMRAIQLIHRADTLAHKTADAATITAPAATDLTTAITLANELKADHNTHIAALTLHQANDGQSIVTATNASDQTSLDTLLNEMKADMNLHFLSGPISPMLRLVDS